MNNYYDEIIDDEIKQEENTNTVNNVIVNDDNTCVSITNLIKRALLIDFLGYLLITLIIINFISGFPYFIIATILGILQFSLVIASSFMILYNKKQKGIHDILTKTKIRVIE